MAIFKNFVAKSQKCFCKWTFTLIKNFFWWKLSFFENCQHNKWWLFFATFSLKCGYFWYFGGGAKSGYFWEFCGWKAWKCFGNTESKQNKQIMFWKFWILIFHIENLLLSWFHFFLFLEERPTNGAQSGWNEVKSFFDPNYVNG